MVQEELPLISISPFSYSLPHTGEGGIQVEVLLELFLDACLASMHRLRAQIPLDLLPAFS